VGCARASRSVSIRGRNASRVAASIVRPADTGRGLRDAHSTHRRRPTPTRLEPEGAATSRLPPGVASRLSTVVTMMVGEGRTCPEKLDRFEVEDSASCGLLDCHWAANSRGGMFPSELCGRVSL
jgi:hypothetical protein